MTVTITTALPHGYVPGDVICLADIAWILLDNGDAPDQLNGTCWCVDTVPTITSLTIVECELATQIAYHDGDSDTLITYHFDGTDWTQTGNGLAITASFLNFGDIVGLSVVTWDDDVTLLRLAYVDSQNDEIRTYDFDGTDWAQVGNSFSLTGDHTQMTMAALSNTRIAYLDGGSIEELTTYDFDGTNWAQVGNALSITPNFSTPKMVALSSSRVALVKTTDKELTAYDFDGTDWAQVGNALDLSALGDAGGIATLGAARVAIDYAGSPKTLRTYDFDGTDWAQVGNSFTLPAQASAGSHLAGMSAFRVAYVDNYTNAAGLQITAYDFGGTDWSQVGNTLTIATAGGANDNPRITSVYVTGAAPDTTGWTAYDNGGVILEQVEEVTGIDHLEGETVEGIVDGIPFDGKTVVSGTISLEGSKAQIGLPYCARFKSLEQNYGAPSGEAMGKDKRIASLDVALLWASDFTYGDDLLDTLFASTNPFTNVFTGERQLLMDSGWSDDERYVFEICEPLPWFCLAVMPNMITNDLI